VIGKIPIELAFPRNYNLGARGTGSSNPLCSSEESANFGIPVSTAGVGPGLRWDDEFIHAMSHPG
jgi:hypothetical protein